MPTAEIAKQAIEEGIGVVDLFAIAQPGTSKNDNRRLIEQGGAQVNGRVVKDIHALITMKEADADGEFILKTGKKRIIRVIVK
jgi:tyrosine--tRNA ligase